MKTVYTFFISGRGQFPLELLSDQECWPFKPRDALALRQIRAEENAELAHRYPLLDRVVALRSYKKPERGEWAAAGWPIYILEQESA
jgi:hypothetical protein